MALAAHADFLAVLDARRNLHGQRFRFAARTLDGQLHLAAGDGRDKRNLDVLEQIGAALRAARRFAALAGGSSKLAKEIAEAAKPFLAESLAEELAQIDVSALKPPVLFRPALPRPPGDQFHE